MTINQTQIIPVITSAPNQDLTNSSPNKQKMIDPPSVQPVSANVILSEKATQLLSSSNNGINEEKVENIKQAICESKYSIDNGKIADAIINRIFQQPNRRTTWR